MNKYYIPRYFTLDELTKSTTATRNNINNEPDLKSMKNIYDLIEFTLDPAREMWGRPITVSSGYRSKKLNYLVGGARCSSHLTGQAADITVGGKEQNWKLYQMIKASSIPYTKLIYEHNSNNIYWIHISLVKENVLRRCYIYDPETKIYKQDN